MAGFERKSSKNILTLTDIEKEQFFDSFDFVLSDCDGVLWGLANPITGINVALRALKNNGKRIIYVSNNSVRTMESYRAQLHSVEDFSSAEEDIYHPARTVIDYLALRKFTSQTLCYVIGSSNFKQLLRNAGLTVLDGPDEPIEESLRVAADKINDTHGVKAVIVDFDLNFNYIKLLRAQVYLQKDSECLLIVCATDKMLPVSKMNLAGNGWFVDILQKMADVKPIVLGKPGRLLGEYLKRDIPISNPKRVLFVGDQLEQDILFGCNAGFQTLLVFTGSTTKQVLQDTQQNELIPDFYTESFADLGNLVHDVMAFKEQKSKSSL